MNAFDEAIERIDEIDAPKEFQPTIKKAFKLFSNYFDKHPEVEIDFNRMFEEKVYKNDAQHLKIRLFDKKSEKTNGSFSKDYVMSIAKKEKYDDYDVHTFVHEFLHLIHYSECQSVFAWANEMMTEFCTMEITGKNYGDYAGLQICANFINKKIHTLSVADYLNNDFEKFLHDYNMIKILPELNKVMKKNYVKDSFTKLAEHFIELRTKIMLDETTKVGKFSQKLCGKNLTLSKFVKDLVGFSVLNAQYDKYVIIDKINKSVVDYCKKIYEANFNIYELKKVINEYVEPYYIKTYAENIFNKKVLVMDKFNFGQSTNFLIKFEDSKYLFTDASTAKIDNFWHIPGKTVHFKKTRNGYNYEKTNDPERNIIFEDSEKVNALTQLKLKIKDVGNKVAFPKNYDHKSFNFEKIDFLQELENQVESYLNANLQKKKNVDKENCR